LVIWFVSRPDNTVVDPKDKRHAYNPGLLERNGRCNYRSKFTVQFIFIVKLPTVLLRCFAGVHVTQCKTAMNFEKEKQSHPFAYGVVVPMI
jgi:hypothetical protein